MFYFILMRNGHIQGAMNHSVWFGKLVARDFFRLGYYSYNHMHVDSYKPGLCAREVLLLNMKDKLD